MALITIKNAAINLDASEIPNLDASKITSGTISNDRLNITQFDDNKIVNDISTLGLRVHTQENLNASNTNSASFDVFQDSSGITNLTNAVRNSDEYVSSGSSTTHTPTVSALTNSGGANNSPTFSIDTSSGVITHDTNSTSRDYDDNDIFGVRVDYGTNIEFSSPLTYKMTDRLVDSGNDNTGLCEFNFSTGAGSGYLFGTGGGQITPTVLKHSNANAWAYLTSSDDGFFYDGSRTYDGMYTNSQQAIIKYSWTANSGKINARYIDLAFANTWARIKTFEIYQNATGTTTNSQGGTNILVPLTVASVSATGSFEGVAITAPSSVSKMGAVLTYQDFQGTNALNTDIVLKLSADNGSNYSTATLTALPDFASGIKCAKVNDLSVTSGSSLKYKIEFANQASGSKEARIRGVSLQY